jgi:hypothetical protein
MLHEGKEDPFLSPFDSIPLSSSKGLLLYLKRHRHEIH